MNKTLNNILRSIPTIGPVRFFVLAAIFFECVFNLVTPPLQAPDEFSHFYRAYKVSQGFFLPQKTDLRLGGEMPQGFIDFSAQYRNSAYIIDYTITHKEVWQSCKIKLQSDSVQFQDFANTSYYSPVSYLPQALAMSVLGKMGANVAVLYYGGRFFSFMFWLLCMAFVIKTVPVFKWLFTLLILLPMQLYSANSFSADTVTNALSFLLMGLVLKHVFVTGFISVKHLSVLALVSVLLVLAKVVYGGLILTLLLIPARKFGSTKAHWLKLFAVYFVALATMYLWSGEVMHYYIPFKGYNPEFRDLASLSPCGDYYAQQSYILNHNLYFLKVIYNSLFVHPRTYLSGYIGVFGNGDIGMPSWLYTLSYILIIVVAFGEKNQFVFKARQKLILILAACTTTGLLLLSQHLIWDCVGEGIVDLLQGRYLIPVFPLFFMLFNFQIARPGVYIKNLVIVLVIFLNLYACTAVYRRFFVGRTFLETGYYCDAEQLDDYGAFKTSNYDVFLNNGNCRTGSVHRNGNCSALLSPQSPYCFTYKLKGLKPGDIIEVEAWEKGTGALIVVSEKKEGCGEKYFAGTYNSIKDKQGWQRIKNVYQLQLNCNASETAIYIWNPGKDKIYIDDLKVTVKKFRQYK